MLGRRVLTAAALTIGVIGEAVHRPLSVSAQAEAVVLNTADEGPTPTPMRCREGVAADETLNALQQVIQAPASQSQRAEKLRNVYPDATGFQSWELPSCELLLRRRITDQQYLTFLDETVPLLITRASLSTPELQEPKEGAVFNVYPRRTAVSWKAVPGAAKYVLEVQILMCAWGVVGTVHCFLNPSIGRRTTTVSITRKSSARVLFSILSGRNRDVSWSALWPGMANPAAHRDGGVFVTYAEPLCSNHPCDSRVPQD
jgi:hypothetical protein